MSVGKMVMPVSEVEMPVGEVELGVGRIDMTVGASKIMTVSQISVSNRADFPVGYY
jgi:hypothetical protein